MPYRTSTLTPAVVPRRSPAWALAVGPRGRSLASTLMLALAACGKSPDWRPDASWWWSCDRVDESRHGCVLPGGQLVRTCSTPSECGPGWNCELLDGGQNRVCLCAPSPEVCDGRDNDCNGQVDEGALCGVGALCLRGACQCASISTITACEGRCVDVRTDPAACGGCGHSCLPGATCQNGSCVCGGVTVAQCGTTCTDVATDTNNCGLCGNVCPAGTRCVAGGCRCPTPGTIHCVDGCRDLSSDPATCGRCDHACAAGEVCEGGTCTPSAEGDAGLGDAEAYD